MQFARENKTLSPSRLAEIVLNRRNKKISPESVTMWFKRHADIYEQLKKEIVESLPTEKQTVDESIFEKANFQQLPCVRNWIMEMTARELKSRTIETQVYNLKSVCRGKFRLHKIDLVLEGKWCFKHPDRLTLQDAIESITLLKNRGVDTYLYKRALKDFLMSKGLVVGKKIAVGKSKSYGRYANLFVERRVLDSMLSWIRRQNFEMYVADDFMFKTGTRLRATIKALIENINFEQHTITVYDKGRNSLYPLGKPWEKYIPYVLWQNIMQLKGKRRKGKIFQKLRKIVRFEKLNRRALKRFVPDLEPRITFPNHFWRHMFFQHMLRKTDWNYGLCAELGGSTIASLQESYGKPPQVVVRQWGLKYIPTLETKEEIRPIHAIMRLER